MRWLADCVGSRRSLMQFHGQQTTPCKAKAWMTDNLFYVRIKTLCHRTESFFICLERGDRNGIRLQWHRT